MISLNCQFHHNDTSIANMLVQMNRTTGRMRLYIILISNDMTLPPESFLSVSHDIFRILLCATDFSVNHALGAESTGVLRMRPVVSYNRDQFRKIGPGLTVYVLLRPGTVLIYGNRSAHVPQNV